MENSRYYHLCANGDEAHNFVVSLEDYVAAMNLVGVCAANTEVSVVCFSLEDTHPHFLLFGPYSECLKFRNIFKTSYLGHVVQSRGGKDDLTLDIEIIEVNDEDYLKNLGAYVVVQPTKDGKDVMPYDYPWGSGCLYFRRGPYTPVWMFDDDGKIMEPVPIGTLTSRQRRALLHSRLEVPADWLVCNGILLPSNYVDVKRFESIYVTCNRYRAFMASGKNKDEAVLSRMAAARGVSFSYLEARRLCGQMCCDIYGFKDVRRLSGPQRASLARELRNKYHMPFRQLAVLVYLDESEIRKYVR